jgi:mRNA-degrading endonuclease toxin of MazEF toxin-antitoxin module
MIKDFINWIQCKIHLDSKIKYPKFKEGQIWRCSVGINIGSETDGKNIKFNRPVLIIIKFNSNQFWVVLLTSKIKSENEFYYKIELGEKTSFAMLSQFKTLDSKRLQDKIGKISEIELKVVRKKIIRLLQ